MTGLSDEEIPLAERRLVRGRFVMSSPMWLVTLACAVLALGLTWSAMDSPGVKVTINFVEGHGLEPGDAVRYRGIDVGRVDDIALGVGLAGVVVEIDLDEDAEGLARAGSRFWVVRPEIDLTGVSGLDTAVGAKYVAVLPGSSEERQAEFEGLPAQPPDSLGASGVEIVLRGDDRFGLNPGSPVTWRGVEVGQVLSSSISADALHVDTRVRIRKPHDRLLSRESKFWTTSGVQLDVGVTGVELSADTLDEIARGGVAFITPGGAPGADDEIRAGEVFTLHPRPRSAWIDDSEPMPLLRADPPSIVSVASRWQQKYFGLTRNRETVASGIPVRVDREVKVLLPADLLAAFEHAIDQTGTLAYLDPDAEALDLVADSKDMGPHLMLASIAAGGNVPAPSVAGERLRSPTEPEDCYAIRTTRDSGAGSTVVLASIGRHELIDGGDSWTVASSAFDRDSWHGAPVLAAADERVVGILIVTDDLTLIAKIPESISQ